MDIKTKGFSTANFPFPKKKKKVIVIKMTFDPLRSSDKPCIMPELIFSESSSGKLLLTLRSDSLMLLQYKIYVLSQNKHVL